MLFVINLFVKTYTATSILSSNCSTTLPTAIFCVYSRCSSLELHHLFLYKITYAHISVSLHIFDRFYLSLLSYHTQQEAQFIHLTYIIHVVEGRTDQRNAHINLSLINLLLFKLLRYVSAT